MIGVNEAKKGMILDLGGTLYQIIELHLFKLGKGNSEARIRLKLRDLRSGVTTEKVYQTSDNVPRVIVEKREVQYLYSDGDMHHFMDTETFSQMTMTREQLKDTLPYMKEGMTMHLTVYKDEPVSAELPITVDLKVADTPPSYKGDTTQGGGKPAKLETGLSVQVPFFVNIGDTVRIDTRTNQYVERVS